MIFTEQRRHWDALAHVDPYWAVLSDPNKLNGGWDREEFYRTGRHEVVNVIGKLAQLEIEPHGKCLDLGCGPGRNTHALVKYFDEVVGYDISPQMLELAREGAAENEQFILNETDDLAPFADGEFDLVFSIITLQHIELGRLPAYIAECHRVLKPGGIFYFQYISHPSGQPGTGESGPDPQWNYEGVRPYYEVNPVRLDAMCNVLLAYPFVVVQARQTDAGGQSFFSYDYVVQKWPAS